MSSTLKIIDCPLDWILYSTILPADFKNYSYNRFLLWPLAGIYIPLCCITKSWVYIDIVYKIISLVAFVYVVFYLWLDRNSPPKGYMAIRLLSFMVGLIYLETAMGVWVERGLRFGVEISLNNTFIWWCLIGFMSN
jgi:hypothetical protein